MFKLDELLLRKVRLTDIRNTDGKLASNWEGPYKTKAVIQAGAYNLAITVDPKALHLSFNDDELMKLSLLMILCLISFKY